LCAQVILGDEFVVDDCEGMDASEDEVFGYFVCEGFHCDEEDVGIADLFLGLDTPESDLTVVECDFIWLRLETA